MSPPPLPPTYEIMFLSRGGGGGGGGVGGGAVMGLKTGWPIILGLLHPHTNRMPSDYSVHMQLIHMYTVRKKDLILRPIERMLQMQFSMARKFPLYGSYADIT
jgi:hypothetical protein